MVQNGRPEENIGWVQSGNIDGYQLRARHETEFIITNTHVPLSN
jgi:hypothetical protein